MNADLALPHEWEESVDLDAPQAAVFDFADDFERLGAHMTCVIERTPPLSKSWETVGNSRMPILEAYRMGFDVVPEGRGSRLILFIEYALPRAGLRRLIGRVLGRWYALRCVRGMLSAALRRFGRGEVSSAGIVASRRV